MKNQTPVAYHLKVFLQNMIAFTGYQFTRRDTLEHIDDDEFVALFRSIQPKTVVYPEKMYVIYQLARACRDLPGDVAQVGVYKGGSAKVISTVLPNKQFYLFDTFTGLPTNELGFEGFSDTSKEEVEKFIANDKAIIKEGFFPDTAKGLEDKKFCFVYLDADLKKSTQDGLEFFYPRTHGAIVIDDYGAWPGVKEAVDEYAKSQNTFVLKLAPFQAVLLKLA